MFDNVENKDNAKNFRGKNHEYLVTRKSSILQYFLSFKITEAYHNDPMFSDGQALANSSDQDQTAPLTYCS